MMHVMMHGSIIAWIQILLFDSNNNNYTGINYFIAMQKDLEY